MWCHHPIANDAGDTSDLLPSQRRHLLNITAKGKLKSPTLTINMESMVGYDNPMLIDTSRRPREGCAVAEQRTQGTKDTFTSCSGRPAAAK
jgi:hypothetical protein